MICALYLPIWSLSTLNPPQWPAPTSTKRTKGTKSIRAILRSLNLPRQILATYSNRMERSWMHVGISLVIFPAPQMLLYYFAATSSSKWFRGTLSTITATFQGSQAAYGGKCRTLKKNHGSKRQSWRGVTTWRFFRNIAIVQQLQIAPSVYIGGGNVWCH